MPGLPPESVAARYRREQDEHYADPRIPDEFVLYLLGGSLSPERIIAIKAQMKQDGVWIEKRSPTENLA